MKYFTWLALALMACSGGTEPNGTPTTPRVGRYAYTSALPATGELVLTFASPDSIAGYWAVPEYNVTLLFGGWNVDAYSVWSQIPGTGNGAHRVWTTTEGAFCSMREVYLTSGGSLVSIPHQCTLSYIGP